MKLHKKKDSETDFSSDSNYVEFANEITYVGNIMQPFQFEPIFTTAEIQQKKDLAGTSAYFLTSSYITELDT